MTTAPPLCIEIMLACYYSTSPEEVFGRRWNLQVIQDFRRWLIQNDLITEDHEATDRGRAWVDYICRTPLPVQTWSLPAREEAA
jgi:hypothetical protein